MFTEYLIFISFIIALLLCINLLFATHNNTSDKKTPFECGFTSFITQNRLPFTISFFLFGILFLIFDVEVLLVYPYLVSSSINESYGFAIVSIFILILVIGFVFELGNKALSLDSKQYNNDLDKNRTQHIYSLYNIKSKL